MSRRLLVFTLSALCLSAAWAQKTAERTWSALSPERQERVLRNYRRYQALSPEDRRRVEERFEEFQNLPKKRREEMVQKWRRFEALTPAKRQELRQRLQRAASGFKSGKNRYRAAGAIRERGAFRNERRSGPSSGRGHGPRERGGADHHPHQKH